MVVPVETPEPEEEEDSRPTGNVQSPRGTQDVLPYEQKYWEYVVETTKSVFRGWHFQRIDTPIFEETELFTRSIGQDTDIVAKELFELKTRGGGAHYSLRPEGTAPIVRAYIEHGLRSWPKPVKLFYIGPIFRYDRPQAGRWRQFHQFGVEVFGSAAPVTDAQIIYVAHILLQQLGLEDYTVHINSLGEPAERKAYIKLLKDHYRRNRSKLCKDCKERLISNPLRLLDCKEEKCQQLANTAPRLLDHLSEAARHHFEQVLSILDELKVPYAVTPSLVRGLDYYTHTVFEFVPRAKEGAPQNSLIAGGRYNLLVKQLGGKETSAVGLAGGIERIIDQLKVEGVELTTTDVPLLFVAHLGEQAKHHTLRLLRQLQEAGIPFAESLDRDGMQPQLKLADRLGVQWALIIGHKEVIDKTVILRSMESGMQEVISQETMVEDLKRRFNIPIE
ncbi:MAG: histidine--tRNA ligase [Candidatus Andersenbacteria bacterium]